MKNIHLLARPWFIQIFTFFIMLYRYIKVISNTLNTFNLKFRYFTKMLFYWFTFNNYCQSIEAFLFPQFIKCYTVTILYNSCEKPYEKTAMHVTLIDRHGNFQIQQHFYVNASIKCYLHLYYGCIEIHFYVNYIRITLTHY